MSNTLLPCPFCGETPILELLNDGFFDYARIRCCRVTFDWCGDETGEKAIAAWNRRVDARQLALKTRVCPMCEDCPDGCPVETPKDSRNIVTNADRIRSMTDEELAQFLGDEPPYFATYKQYIDWLRKPNRKRGRGRLTIKTDICIEPENEIVYHNPNDPKDELVKVLKHARDAIDGYSTCPYCWGVNGHGKGCKFYEALQNIDTLIGGKEE